MTKLEVSFEELYATDSRNGIYKPKEFHGRGTKIVNMGELFGYDFIGDQPMERIDLTPDEMKRSILEDGDLLFGRRSLVEAGAGKCSIVVDPTEPLTFESSIIRVRPDKEKVNPLYLFYYFRSSRGRGRISAIVSGTNVKGIRSSDLAKVLIAAPAREIQDYTCDVLSSYDDLISNNKRRITLLEQSARLLFKEWFVHLRYPGHEHDEVVDAVPQGWEAVAVSDVISVNPKEVVANGAELWHVPMSSLSEIGMAIDRVEFERRTKHTNVKFRNGDTLFARITPSLENGKTGFVDFLEDGEVGCGSTEFIVLRGVRVSAAFTYCLARTEPLRQLAIKSMTGSSGRQRVQEECFDKFRLALPPRKLLNEFDDIVSICFSQSRNLRRQNEMLTKARDFLLPRLMDGRLSV